MVLSKTFAGMANILLLIAPLAAEFTAKLSSYKISDVTVSGVSAGGYMAVQLHIAFSSIINGSAIFAGGPFYCAESTILYAEKKCMAVDLGGPDTQKLIELTWADATLGYIDNPLNLIGDRVYIFSGKDDSVVNSKVGHALETYYSSFVGASNIVADYNIEAEHCLPTLSYGENCKTLSSPFLGNCEFDGAGIGLKTIYGDDLKSGEAIPANFKAFDQRGYFKSKTASLADTGYVYVPSACADSKVSCSLHISFHGCEQGADFIGSTYAEHAGFNSWAEANNIIVLYPYVSASSSLPTNPNGCWDWWAYTDVYYGVQSGVQMKFVKALIDDLSGISSNSANMAA